jgi:hypothetical protein
MISSPLPASELIALAERYFAAVDRMDVVAVRVRTRGRVKSHVG